VDFHSSDSYRLQPQLEKESEAAKSQDSNCTKLVKTLFSLLSLVSLVTAVANIFG
jgi:hypothetical protein